MRIGRILRQARQSQNALLKLQKIAAKMREMLIMHTFTAIMRFHIQIVVQKEDALLHLYSALLFSDLSCIKFIL